MDKANGVIAKRTMYNYNYNYNFCVRMSMEAWTWGFWGLAENPRLTRHILLTPASPWEVFDIKTRYHRGWLHVAVK